MTEEAPTLCPHCGGALGLSLVAKLKSESRMSYTVHPKDGELITAETLGGTINQVSKMLKAIGRELGVKTVVMIEGISTTPEGGLKTDLLICRQPKDGKVLTSPDPST